MAITNDSTGVKPYVSQALMEFEPQQSFIAPMISKPLFVADETGTFFKVKRESTIPSGDELRRAKGAVFPRRSTEGEQQEYACVGYGEEEPIPFEDIAKYKSLFSAELNAAGQIKGDLYANREARIRDLLIDTATWAGASLYKDWSAAPWDVAGSAVMTHIALAKEAVRSNCGLQANALILSEVQRQNLINVNTQIIARVTNTTQLATPEVINSALAAILGLKYVFSGSSVYNSAKKGQDASITNVWSEDYAMVCRVAETENPREMCVARSLVWTDVAGADVRIETYEEKQTNSIVVQGHLNEDELVIDPYCGFLMLIDA